MFTKSKQRVFIPVMLMGFLCFGAAAAEARDYRSHGDRVKKDAVIGAAVGTLVQILGGRTEGHELLQGAVIGGTLGAAVGATRDSHRGYYRDGYYRDGYYRDGYYRDGYSSNGYYDRNGYYDQGGYYSQDGYYDRNGGYQNGYYQDGYYRDSYDSRYDRRSSHRHSRSCGHR
jgi:hypothetical protein